MAKISLNLAANYAKGKITLSVVKEGTTARSFSFDTKRASKLAGDLLELAKKAHDLSGKPPPVRAKDEELEFTAVRPSGHTVGPGRKSTSTTMIFYFGETVLGIELPNEDAQILARRLMTSAVDKSAAQ